MSPGLRVRRGVGAAVGAAVACVKSIDGCSEVVGMDGVGVEATVFEST